MLEMKSRRPRRNRSIRTGKGIGHLGVSDLVGGRLLRFRQQFGRRADGQQLEGHPCKTGDACVFHRCDGLPVGGKGRAGGRIQLRKMGGTQGEQPVIPRGRNCRLSLPFYEERPTDHTTLGLTLVGGLPVIDPTFRSLGSRWTISRNPAGIAGRPAY